MLMLGQAAGLAPRGREPRPGGLLPPGSRALDGMAETESNETTTKQTTDFYLDLLSSQLGRLDRREVPNFW